MGDSRKYPYHTMDGFSEFRGQGGLFELEFRRHGGILTSGILKAWGGFDLGFTQELLSRYAIFYCFYFPRATKVFHATSINIHKRHCTFCSSF